MSKNAAIMIPNEDWNELQYGCSIENLEMVKGLLNTGADANWATDSMVIPQVTPLHIASKTGNTELIKLLLPFSNINNVDQMGFTPLHYATVARRKDAVMLLLAEGASVAAESKSGNTAKDLAETLGFTDILDALTSKLNLEKDPTVPKFRAWLNSLGGGEYTMKFIDAGYDLPFIVKHGLTDEDLNCVGIPTNKMGLRRKIMKLHGLTNFYNEEEEEEDAEDEDEEGDEEDEEEEGSEEEEDD